MTFCYSHPVLCTLNEIAFSGISLYTLLSPSSLPCALPQLTQAWVQEAQQSSLWGILPVVVQRRLGAASTTGEGRHASAYGAFDMDVEGGPGGKRASLRGREDAFLLGGGGDDDGGVFEDDM